MLLVLCLSGLVAVSLISAVCLPLFGIGFSELGNLTEQPERLEFTRFLLFSQALSAIGLFIMPPVIYMLWQGRKILPGLSLDKRPPALLLLLAVLLMLCQLPLINALAELNLQLQLPEALSGIQEWMQRQEDQAARLTQSFLSMSGPVDLLITLLVMAVLPGFGEELLFRATLQPLLTRITGNAHAAVWIAAFVFSFIHFQFFGFLPRFLMGAFMGYLFLWSRNAWVPVAAHFTNNAAAVTGHYLLKHGYISGSADDLGIGEGRGTEVLISLLLLATGLLAFYRLSRRASGLIR